MLAEGSRRSARWTFCHWTIQYILSVKLLFSHFHTYKGKHTNFHELTVFSFCKLFFIHINTRCCFYGLQSFFFSFFKLVICRRKCTLNIHIKFLSSWGSSIKKRVSAKSSAQPRRVCLRGTIKSPIHRRRTVPFSTSQSYF